MNQSQNNFNQTNDFNQSQNNFNQTNYFNQSQNNFDQTKNFNQSQNNFDQTNNFNQSQNNFNQSQNNFEQTKNIEQMNNFEQTNNFNQSQNNFDQTNNFNQNQNTFNNYNQNQNTFNQSQNNFNQNQNNFNQNQNNFNQSQNNFNQSQNNFNQPNNFNQSQNNFEQTKNFNQSTNNFNQTQSSNIFNQTSNSLYQPKPELNQNLNSSNQISQENTNTINQNNISQIPKENENKKYTPQPHIDTRSELRFSSIKNSQNLFFDIQNRINEQKKKINTILSNHQKYNYFKIYYKIFSILRPFGEEPKRFFSQRDPNKTLHINLFDFSSVLSNFGVNLNPEELNLIIQTLNSKVNGQYNYDEFLKNVVSVQQKDNGTLWNIFHDCNYNFNDYLIDFRRYIKDNNINYKNEYSIACSNMLNINFEIFKKFLNKINFTLPHDEEIKYLYSNICDQNYQWDNVLNDIIKPINQQNLFNCIDLNEMTEEDFIKKGKMIKDSSTKGNLIKNLKKFQDGPEENKNLYSNEYKQHEFLFKNIKTNLKKFQINDIVDYFENSNEDITDEGEIDVESFKKLMRNIDISENLHFFKLLNDFTNKQKGPGSKVKLAEFVWVYKLFDEPPKNNNVTNNLQNNNKNNENKSEEISTSKKDKVKDSIIDDKNKKIVYKTKNIEFTQEDIDHVRELSQFVADIIIDEKHKSIENFIRPLDNENKGYITLEKVKSIFRNDLEIEIDDNDSMKDFFDFIISDEKMNDEYIVNTNRLIQTLIKYGGRSGPKIANLEGSYVKSFEKVNLYELSNQNNNTKEEKNNNQTQSAPIQIPEWEKIMKSFSDFITKNKIRFGQIFPSIYIHKVNDKQMISSFELQKGFQNASYPIEQNQINILLNKFDPVNRNNIRVIDLINIIKKYSPNYFDEPYQNKSMGTSALAQSNLPVNQNFKTNIAINGIKKIKSYINNNKLQPNAFFSKILNKNNMSDLIGKEEFSSTLRNSINDLKEEEVNQIFDIIDNDKDKQIEFSQLMNYFIMNNKNFSQNYNKSMQEIIHSLFESSDLDHDEMISGDDFHKCLQILNKKISKNDSNTILQKYNNNNTSIAKKDFNTLVSKFVYNELGNQQREREQITQIFKDCDTEKNGYLTSKQLKYILKNKFNTDYTEEDINNLCDKASIVYNDLIDYNEFVNILENLNVYNQPNNNENDLIVNNLGLNSFSKFHPKYYNSIFEMYPLTFTPSFIREEQKKLNLLLSSALKPKKETNGIFFSDIKPLIDKNPQNKKKTLNPVSCKIDSKISFVKYATGIPIPGINLFFVEKPTLEICHRLLKIGLYNTVTKTFIGNAISIECNSNKERPNRWVFEEDRTKFNNNIIIRYNDNDSDNINAIFEFVLVIKNSNDISSNDSIEISCGWAYISLKEFMKEKEHKLEINGGNPLNPEKISVNDILKKGGVITGLSSKLSGDDKSELKIKIKPFKELNSDDRKVIDFLPQNIVCHRAGIHLISLYRKIIGEYFLNNEGYGTKILDTNINLINSFGKICDCQDSFKKFIELWKELIIDGATSSERKNEVFLKNKFVMFNNRIYTVLFAEKFKYDVNDPTKIITDLKVIEDRNNLITSALKYDKSGKMNKVNYEQVINNSIFKPFSMSEISRSQINFIGKYEEMTPYIDLGRKINN